MELFPSGRFFLGYFPLGFPSPSSLRLWEWNFSFREEFWERLSPGNPHFRPHQDSGDGIFPSERYLGEIWDIATLFHPLLHTPPHHTPHPWDTPGILRDPPGVTSVTNTPTGKQNFPPFPFPPFQDGIFCSQHPKPPRGDMGGPSWSPGGGRGCFVTFPERKIHGFLILELYTGEIPKDIYYKQRCPWNSRNIRRRGGLGDTS